MFAIVQGCVSCGGPCMCCGQAEHAFLLRRGSVRRVDSAESECASSGTAHVCRLLAGGPPLSQLRLSGVKAAPRPQAPPRERAAYASSAAAADARAAKALCAARAMAVEAQAASGGVGGGSGRSSLDGVGYNASVGSALSDGSHFEADGRCHSPGTYPRSSASVGAGLGARGSEDLEMDDGCSAASAGGSGELAERQPSGLSRASGAGSLRAHGRAGSLRSMCSDLHDMGTLLGAPSDAHTDLDEARAPWRSCLGFGAWICIRPPKISGRQLP